MNERVIRIKAYKNYDRLDIFISLMAEITRSYAGRIIKAGNVKNLDSEKNLKPSSKVKAGEKFSITLPEINQDLQPEDIPIEIVYADEFLAVINKPAGLVVHPAAGNYEHTLLNGLIKIFPEIKNLSDKNRPGIVHRLDAGTSGLMIIAREQRACDELKIMFQAREVKKKYLALIHGCPKLREGILSGAIDHDPENYLKMALIEGGRPAMTGYKILWTRENLRGEKISLVQCDLFTGRTHQIRVHLAALGCPLVGDALYGAKDRENNLRVLLHSWKLEFAHPITKKLLTFRKFLPEDFLSYIRDKITKI